VTDDVELALFVVEAEDQRAERVRLLPEAEGGHHAVGGAQPLDLRHPLSLAG
jgi:hypothetical protein